MAACPSPDLPAARSSHGDIVFGTTRTARKCTNLSRQPRVAIVIGFDWADEQTVQLEGTAAEIQQDHPAVAAYYKPHRTGPGGMAADRLRPRPPGLGRLSDYRPESFGNQEIPLA